MCVVCCALCYVCCLCVVVCCAVRVGGCLLLAGWWLLVVLLLLVVVGCCLLFIDRGIVCVVFGRFSVSCCLLVGCSVLHAYRASFYLLSCVLTYVLIWDVA